jgi:hypothetical protein
MATGHDKSPGITCAENISALYFLHSVPESPSRNVLSERRHHEHGYTLSIAEELRLVEALAFLSNANDNPNRVPAICVQEVSGTSTLNVLLAVNQSEWCDGSQSLQQLKEGFVEVFTQLAKLEHGEAKKFFPFSLPNNVTRFRDSEFGGPYLDHSHLNVLATNTPSFTTHKGQKIKVKATDPRNPLDSYWQSPTT